MNEVRPKPRISIVTVVWNNLEGLKLTAANIQQQHYENLHHIVIDGASDDGTSDWLASYRPRFTTTLISEPDDGLYQAMNKGIKLADGDLVAFLNGGDTFCDPEVLTYVAGEWSRGTWLWGYGGINYIDSERKKLSSFNLVPFAPRRVQLGLTYVPHPSTFMSRAMLRELGGFRPEFGWSADQELGIRAAFSSSPAVWDRSITDFLVGGAHSQGSLRGVARRYRKIRLANEVPFLGSKTSDSVYTELVAGYWTARSWAGTKFRSRKGVDSVRSK